MNDLLNYILTGEDAFRKYAPSHTPAPRAETGHLTQIPRNRLPSLYSDFSLQKRTNPDGYDVNVSAWEKALTRAARHGYLSASHAAADGLGHRANDKHAPPRTKGNHLLLRADETLLRDLEIPELGVPVALGAVFVCFSLSHQFTCLPPWRGFGLANAFWSRTRRFRNVLWSPCNYTRRTRSACRRVSGASLIQGS